MFSKLIVLFNLIFYLLKLRRGSTGSQLKEFIYNKQLPHNTANTANCSEFLKYVSNNFGYFWIGKTQ